MPQDGPGYGPPPSQRGYGPPPYERGYGPPVERGPNFRLIWVVVAEMRGDILRLILLLRHSTTVRRISRFKMAFVSRTQAAKFSSS